jgi:hypothetical protein
MQLGRFIFEIALHVMGLDQGRSPWLLHDTPLELVE